MPSQQITLPGGLLLGFLAAGCAGPQLPAKTESPKREAVPPAAPSAPSPSSPQRAAGKTFSVPIPAGYVWLHKALGSPLDSQIEKVNGVGGVLLMAKQRPPVENAFVGSIAVLPAAGGGEINAKPEMCRDTGALMAKMAKARLEEAGLVELGGSLVCQWTVAAQSSDPKPTRRAMGTVMVQETEVWVVTCNYDSRDQSARAACHQVLAGWSFRGAGG